MNTRFYNARIITMEPAEDGDMYGTNPVSGELHVQDNTITYVGESGRRAAGSPVSGSAQDVSGGSVSDNARDVSGGSVSGSAQDISGGPVSGGNQNTGPVHWDREIDCGGNILLPGLKNAHTHSAMTFLRSYADDLPLSEWLYDKVFPMEAKLTTEDQYTLSKLAMLEYLMGGITANFDMYLDNPTHARASLDMGFRSVFCGGMNDFGGTVERTEAQFHEINAMGELVSCQLGFHAEYTTKRESVEALADLANRLKMPMYLHLSETEEEVKGCVERYGMSPVKFLDSVGMFRYGGGGFHGVWLDGEDMDICAERNVSIVSNPCSNLKLASGIADLCALLDRGVNVALGTDGAASNNALNMFREMYLASVLPKVKYKDASAMDARAVLRMATVGGAAAMGLSDCDTLAVGKKADLILLDMHCPNMQPENNIVKNIVYSGGRENVKLTMVNGKILYEDGRFFIDEDIDEIYKKSAGIIGRMK